jgi:hypothetical protein
MGSQMMVFDPEDDGFYLALGPSYASRQDVYHFHEDFARRPELFMEAIPPAPLVAQAAEIENRLATRLEKLGAYKALADAFGTDANILFIVARNAFLASEMDVLDEYAEKAFSMQPSVPEYRLYAGMAAYHRKQLDRAVQLLEGTEVSDLSPEQELYRSFVLEQAWAGKDPSKAAKYADEKCALLDRHGAHAYFESEIRPLLDALEEPEIERG